MRTLIDVEEMITGFKEYDFKLFYDVLCEKTNTEKELFERMEICKYIKKNYEFEKNEVFKRIGELDVQFFKYIERKVDLKYGKKQYQLMLDYLRRLKDYFEISEVQISFDTIFDYFLYVTMFPDISKGVAFNNNINGWLFYKMGIAYENLKIYDVAEYNFNKCISCLPMSFTPYEELCRCSYMQGDYEKLEKYLKNCYKFAKTSQDLGNFYYYYCLYFFKTNNFQAAKAAAMIAYKFDIQLSYRNKILEIFKEIDENEDVISNVFVSKPENVLKQNGLPLWFSKDIVFATLVVYKACVTKAIDDKKIKATARKNLMYYKLNAYIEQIETNVFTDYNQILLEDYEISIKLNKKWKTRYVNDSTNDKGFILEAVDSDNTLLIALDKHNNISFDDLCNDFVDGLAKNNFNMSAPQHVLTIDKRDIVVFEADDGLKLKECYMIVEINGLNFVLSINTNINKEKNIKELYEIIHSMKHFDSINKKY